jgi:MiaB/RimO family radical SAM methylthiotransferase
VPKVYVTHNGCEEGALKSMHVQQFFVKNGFTATRDPEKADFVIFFACGLTDPKEKHSLMLIRRLQGQKKNTADLIVWGCLPKINPKSLVGYYDGPIVGPKDLEFFENLLEETAVEICDVSANALMPQEVMEGEELTHKLAYDPINDVLYHLRKYVDLLRLPKRKWLFESTSFFIRVAEGCSGNCTYCSERPAWGRVKSKPIPKIIEEFKRGLTNGYSRFFLVAADLGSYGTDIGSSPVDLLEEIVKAGEQKNYSVIINQMNPRDLKRLLPGIAHVLASGRIESLGCQVESGSNRILELMGRKYAAEDWRASLLSINSKFPFVRLTTHIMIGFPTETDQDFEATIKLLDFPLFIDSLYFFKFSPRPTVYASRLPNQVPEKVKELRAEKLYRKYQLMYALNVALGNVRYLVSKIWRNTNHK